MIFTLNNMNTIIKKWKPILKELNIDENYWEDIALFCEKKTFKEKDGMNFNIPRANKKRRFV